MAVPGRQTASRHWTATVSLATLRRPRPPGRRRCRARPPGRTRTPARAPRGTAGRVLPPRRVVPIPTANVLAVAIENAEWIGVDDRRHVRLHERRARRPAATARIAAPGVAHAGQRLEAAARRPAPAPTCGGTPADAERRRQLARHRGREHRPGDREPDRAADLLEERQVARRRADLPAPARCSGRSSGNTANIGPTPRPVTNIHAHRIGQRRVGPQLGQQRDSPAARTTSAPKISSR